MARHHRATGRGQALVEFALVLPIFLLLLFGFLDVARYVYATNAYGQAAREGARWGSVEQWSYECPGSVSPQTRKACTEAVTLESRPGRSAGTGVGHVHLSGHCRAGDVFSVTVTGPFRFFTPVISNLLGTPVISQTAQVVIQ